MAEFIISVEAKVIIPYEGKTSSIVEESCSSNTLVYPIEVYYDSPTITYEGSSIFLLTKVEDIVWKTLTISNIVYYDETKFYLDFNGTSLAEETSYDFDISSLFVGDSVPNLTFKNNLVSGYVGDNLISYDINITDADDVMYGTVSSNCALFVTSCNSITTWTDLTDTADSITPGEVVVANAEGTALEFTTLPSTEDLVPYGGAIKQLSMGHNPVNSYAGFYTQITGADYYAELTPYQIRHNRSTSNFISLTSINDLPTLLFRTSTAVSETYLQATTTATGYYTSTLQAKSGTVAFLSDVQGTNTVTKTADYSALVGDIIAVDTSAGEVNITLPDLLTSLNGGEINICKIDNSANKITVIGTPINGETNAVLTSQWDNITLISFGTFWVIK